MMRCLSQCHMCGVALVVLAVALVHGHVHALSAHAAQPNGHQQSLAAHVHAPAHSHRLHRIQADADSAGAVSAAASVRVRTNVFAAAAAAVNAKAMQCAGAPGGYCTNKQPCCCSGGAAVGAGAAPAPFCRASYTLCPHGLLGVAKDVNCMPAVSAASADDKDKEKEKEKDEKSKAAPAPKLNDKARKAFEALYNADIKSATEELAAAEKLTDVKRLTAIAKAKWHLERRTLWLDASVVASAKALDVKLAADSEPLYWLGNTGNKKKLNAASLSEFKYWADNRAQLSDVKVMDAMIKNQGVIMPPAAAGAGQAKPKPLWDAGAVKDTLRAAHGPANTHFGFVLAAVSFGLAPNAPPNTPVAPSIAFIGAADNSVGYEQGSTKEPRKFPTDLSVNDKTKSGRHTEQVLSVMLYEALLKLDAALASAPTQRVAQISILYFIDKKKQCDVCESLLNPFKGYLKAVYGDRNAKLEVVPIVIAQNLKKVQIPNWSEQDKN